MDDTDEPIRKPGRQPVPETAFERVLVPFTEALLVHRIPVIFALLALSVTAGYSATTLEPNFSLRSFFGQGDPDRKNPRGVSGLLGSDDAFVLLLVRPTSGELVTRERLARAGCAEADGFPRCGSLRPRTHRDSLIASREEGVLGTAPMIDGMPEEEEWAEWEAHIRSNTFLVPALLSPSGKAAALIIEFDGDTDDAAEIVALVNRLRDELEPFQGSRAFTTPPPEFPPFDGISSTRFLEISDSSVGSRFSSPSCCFPDFSKWSGV